MLIPSHRPTDDDMRVWTRLEAFDRRRGQAPIMARRIADAQRHLAAFVADGPCYLGVSWGKDSVCVAGLVALMELPVPMVWVRIDGRDNPDCPAVRDAFLDQFPAVQYEEIVIASDGEAGDIVRQGHQDGWKEARRRFGERYISGVRAEESAARALSARAHGHATARTCRPILRWQGVDVFAYLCREGLPVHPAYAMSMGGALERERLRVAALGGVRGTGFGRREREWAYYREELIAMGEDQRVIDRR